MSCLRITMALTFQIINCYDIRINNSVHNFIYLHVKKCKMRATCPNCNKIFEGRGTTKYCSNACSKQYKRLRPGKTEKECSQCGKPIIGNSNRRFCNNTCNQKYLKNNPRSNRILQQKKEPNLVFFDWDDFEDGVI